MRIAAVVLAIGGLASSCNVPAQAAQGATPAAQAAEGAAPAAQVAGPSTTTPAASPVDPASTEPLPAPSGDVEKPKVVALMAAVGDRLSVVRQRPSVGTHIDPTVRRALRVPGQALNTAVLRGLDQGIGQEYPDAGRVLLTWTPPAELEQRLEDVNGLDRDRLLMDAVIEHLRPVAERAQWDRIEVIVPKYRRYEANGMGTKLQGMGLYVQPLGRGVDLIDESIPPGDNEVGGRRVVNPNTGEVVRANTYVAPYMFFERIALDARTLAVVKRQAIYDSVKYNDPMSATRDVWDSMPLQQMLEKLSDLAERSAFQAIRGKGSSVDVSAPKSVAAMPPADVASGATR